MSRKVPELRFKEFSGEWVEKKLGDIGNTFNGLSGKIKKDFGEGVPYIQYMQVFSDYKINVANFGLVKINYNDKQNKVKYGDIFFTTSSETLKEIGLSSVLINQVDEVYLNSFCFGYRPKSLDELMPEFSQFFFRNEIVREKIISLGQGSTRVNISKVKLLELKFYFPKKQEQQKIANTLSSLDNLIEATEKKVEALKKHKKGLMQQLFPADGQKVPELRFDGFSGEWEEKSLEEIINRISSRQYQINSSDYLKEGIYPVVDQGKKNIVAFSNNNSKVIKNNRGLIVFGDHTRIIKYIDFDFVVGADGTQLINVKQEFDLKFFYYQLLNNEIPNTGYNRHFKFLKKINYKVPCEKDKQEQKKIANTLSSLDSLIEATEKKVEALKKHKKGLMQQMFVSKER